MGCRLPKPGSGPPRPKARAPPCASPSSPPASLPGSAWWSCRCRRSPARRPPGPSPTGSASRPSFWPAVSGPLLRCPCTCQPRMKSPAARLAAPHERHRPRAPRRRSGRSRARPRRRAGRRRAACRPSPAPRRPARPRRWSTLPGPWASAAANRSVRENTAARSERCAIAQATAADAGEGGAASRRRFRVRVRVRCLPDGQPLPVSVRLPMTAVPVRAGIANHRRLRSPPPPASCRTLTSRVGRIASRSGEAGSFPRPRRPAHPHPAPDRQPGAATRPASSSRSMSRLLRPRHQRGAFGDARIVGGSAEAARFHGRLDLGPPAREGLDRFPGDAGDLEAPVGMGLLDAVAEPAERPAASSLR